jgi:hypothetical protein
MSTSGVAYAATMRAGMPAANLQSCHARSRERVSLHLPVAKDFAEEIIITRYEFYAAPDHGAGAFE